MMMKKMMVMMSCYCWLQSRNDAPAVGHDLWLRRRHVDVIIIIGHHDDLHDSDVDVDDDDDYLCLQGRLVHGDDDDDDDDDDKEIV